MPSKLDVDVEVRIDRLYQVSLHEFVAARNELASHLQKTGRPDEARRIRALIKPAVSAWAVNQLYWRCRPEFDELIAAGDRVRTAQRTMLSGGSADLPGALEGHRKAVSAAARKARAILAEVGHPSAAITQRLETTLEAIAAHGSTPPTPIAGRLTSDVAPPGFEAFAGLAPTHPVPRSAARSPGPARGSPTKAVRSGVATRPPARVSHINAGRLARARSELAAADAEVEQRRADLERASRELERAETRTREAREEQEAAEQRLAETARRAREAEDMLQRSRAESARATAALTSAEQTVERTRATIAGLQ